MRYKAGDIVGLPRENLVGFEFMFVFGIISTRKPKAGTQYVMVTIQPPTRTEIYVSERDLVRVIPSFAGPVFIEND